MKDWIVRVQVPMKKEFWMGTFQAIDRTQAKRVGRNFVAQHLPLDTRILGIAEGTITVTKIGPEFPMDECNEP